MEKRSLTLAGHRTSVSLEPEFWAALEDRAARLGRPLSAVIRDVDEARNGENLASALRVAILRWSREGRG